MLLESDEKILYETEVNARALKAVLMKRILTVFKIDDLINANFAFKYLYRHKQKFANKRLCIYTE